MFVSMSVASQELLDYFEMKETSKGLFIYKEFQEPVVAIRVSGN